MESLKYPEDYVVVDVETNIKNRGDGSVGNNSGTPHHPDNHIVWVGDKSHFEGCDPRTHVTKFNPSMTIVLGTNWTWLVGHNVKFDLLYMMKDLKIKSKGFILWDTMIVEYLLSGQRVKFASLDQLCDVYDIGMNKDEKIKEYWNDGVDTKDIPEEEIVPYLRQDIEVTEKIFLEQKKAVEKAGLMPLVVAQMKSLHATTIMEYNGMHFDINMAYEKAAEIDKELSRLYNLLVIDMKVRGIVDPNPASNQHISLYLFGGEHTYEGRVEKLDADGKPLRYKTGTRKGEIKTKKTKLKKFITHRLTLPSNIYEKSKTGYKVDDEIINKVIEFCTGLFMFVDVKVFCTALLKYRALFKDLNTYYIGFTKHYWPHDNKIHGTINHCATATGRLSSSNPNLQNLTNG